MTKFLASRIEIDFSVIEHIGDQLAHLSEILPKSSLRLLIGLICRKCSENDWKTSTIPKIIYNIACKHDEVVIELVRFIPPVKTSQSLEHPYFSYFGMTTGLAEKCDSVLFKFWFNVRSMKIEEIVQELVQADANIRYLKSK